jgi:hypothetical protein
LAAADGGFMVGRWRKILAARGLGARRGAYAARLPPGLRRARRGSWRRAAASRVER